MSGFMAAANAMAKSHPVFAAGGTLGVRYGIGDAIVQNSELKASEGSFSWRRLGLFSAFGAFYGAGPAYFLFNKVYPRIFASPGGVIQRPMLLAAFDCATHSPFIYFPAFYCFVAVINKDESTAHTAALAEGIEKWKENFFEDAPACAAVWLPLNAINFKFVPPHLRLPFVSGAGLIWVGVLSFMRGSECDPSATSKSSKEEAKTMPPQK